MLNNMHHSFWQQQRYHAHELASIDAVLKCKPNRACSVTLIDIMIINALCTLDRRAAK